MNKNYKFYEVVCYRFLWKKTNFLNKIIDFRSFHLFVTHLKKGKAKNKKNASKEKLF